MVKHRKVAAVATAVLSARVTPELRDRVERIRQMYQLDAPPGIEITLGDTVRALILDGAARFEADERRKAHVRRS